MKQVVNFKLVRISSLSGKNATFYSIILNNDSDSLFEKFINENKNLLKSELSDILTRLKVMGKETGAREGFFKLYEGNPGDLVCALYDNPRKKLRLYCIRFGTEIVILGGGGEKPKSMRRLQESSKLKSENEILRYVSIKIKQKMDDKDMKFSHDYLEFEGNLEFICHE